MQANVSAIYDMLMSGEKVDVRLNSRQQADNLRIYLVKRHREFTSVGISEGSVLMDWDVDKAIASYRLGQPRRAAAVTFEIVSHEPTSAEDQLSATLEQDQNQHGASESSLSEQSAGETDLCSPEAEDQSECKQESNELAILRPSDSGS